MKIHPLMLAAVVGFWGWQTGQWLVAVPVASLICASFYVSLRWSLSEAQLARVADFCTVLALLTGVFLFVTYGNPRAIILFFEWLPLLFLPVALAHAYGAGNNAAATAERMPLAVLFWSLRRRQDLPPATFDPWWPYYALWIVAAAAANMRGEGFYVGLIALVSWPLVRIRPWSYRVGTWGVSFAAAILLGFALQYGLNYTQGWLEAAVPDWISASGSRTDPYRASTDIGHIGKLKESDAIVLRVTTPDGAAPPRLLHRASYNTYFGAAWLARGVAFADVRSEASQRWPLAPEGGTAARVTIHDYTNRPNPVLSLPTGAWALEKLNAVTLQKNPLGAVQIVREPGFFSYVAVHGGEHAHEGAPGAEDTRVPAKVREAFTALAAELGLSAQAAAAGVEQVQRHFANGYQYSTYRKDAMFVGSPMVDFLHRSKSGHCEYFATATALLLRAGGIPARYATGFVAAEKSDLENAWVVRTRHAHAWVRAWVNGAWIDVDTTPASWLAVEAGQAGAWSKIGDVWAWLRFRASQAWENSDERRLLTGALIVVLPFALWLAWRLWRSRSRAKNIQLKQILTTASRRGADSEFYHVEQRLAEQGHARHAHETAHDWLARLKINASIDTAPLVEMVELHNRYRFDPLGLSEAQRLRLKTAARGWLTGNTGGAAS